MTLTRKRVVLIVAGVLFLVLIIYGFWPDPVSVQTATAERGPMQVTVEEEGETQVRERYVISAPVAAIARRIEVEAGDFVEGGQALVQLEAPRSGILDARTQVEAEGRVAAAQAAVQQADRQVEAAEARAQLAREERARVERLAEDGTATPQAVERAVAEALQAAANLEGARAAAASARANLQSARAALDAPDPAGQQAVRSVLRTPAPGRVLVVHRESAGPVAPGEPLLEVGDTQLLEIRVDVLSQDALQIQPGTRVLLDQWGGDGILEGEVRRVDPQGRTAISALGVEEQRVAVVANLTSPPAQWADLGSGYRVLAQFVVWEEDDVLQVPTGALFRTDDGWALFIIENGIARRRLVSVGRQTGLLAQITAGLDDGEEVITHPGNEVEDGVRVTRRDT